MRTLRRIFKWLSWWATSQQDDERLRGEIDAHIALQIEENIRAGLPEEEARREALWKFGPVEGVKDGYREQRGFPSVETRHALCAAATTRGSRVHDCNGVDARCGDRRDHFHL